MKKAEEILLGEDNRIFVKDLIKRFSENGLNVYKTVTSAEDLIYWAMNSSPGVIISDITLNGDLDGIEAMARIQEVKPIPYIFITGHSEYIPLIESYGLKPVEVFKKPILFPNLLDVIKKILMKER